MIEDGEEQDDDAEHHPPERDAAGAAAGGVGVGELAVLKGGEDGDERGGERDHPELAVDDQSKDDGDEHGGGEDAFHGAMERIKQCGPDFEGFAEIPAGTFVHKSA